MEIISYFCDASLASCAVILNSIKHCTPIKENNVENVNVKKLSKVKKFLKS